MRNNSPFVFGSTTQSSAGFLNSQQTSSSYPLSGGVFGIQTSGSTTFSTGALQGTGLGSGDQNSSLGRSQSPPPSFQGMGGFGFQPSQPVIPEIKPKTLKIPLTFDPIEKLSSILTEILKETTLLYSVNYITFEPECKDMVRIESLKTFKAFEGAKAKEISEYIKQLSWDTVFDEIASNIDTILFRRVDDGEFWKTVPKKEGITLKLLTEGSYRLKKAKWNWELEVFSFIKLSVKDKTMICDVEYIYPNRIQVEYILEEEKKAQEEKPFDPFSCRFNGLSVNNVPCFECKRVHTSMRDPRRELHF